MTSAFAQALRSLHSGRLSRDDVLTEIYRQLTVENAAPDELLEMLEAQQAAEPLPAAAYEAIRHRIANWPQDPTIITGVVAPSSSAAPKPATHGVGDVLQGRFRLLELVDEGGMSHVFKALDLRRVEAGAADPHVAVKVLTEPFQDYFGSLAALQREAHKLQSLTHPNIVRVLDCDRDGQTVFMTMEYLTGESLQKKLRGRGSLRLDRSGAENIIVKTANALDYAHAHQIVHGDLKPGNVIITDQNDVKVIDFGMASFIPVADAPDGEAKPDKPPKAVTPRYASPELLAGQDPEPRDDIYALACIAYEVLSGRHPFNGRGDSAGRDAHAVPAPPLGMPNHQFAALAKALAYERAARTPSVRQFLEEFTTPPRKAAGNSSLWAAILATLLVVLGLLWWNADRLGLRPGHAGAPHLAAGSVLRDCPTCPLMTVLPGGHFLQGAGKEQAGASAFELPQHAVAIAHPIALGTHEVTVAEYREFAEATRRPAAGCNTYDGRWGFRADASWFSPGFAQSSDHPVVCVSWNDAVDYAKWLARRSGKAYRLPSASEWEYAARAGSELAQPWDATGTDACADANVADQTAVKHYPGWDAFPCSDGFVSTAPVGSFKANAFGLSDLLGNAFEWVEDCWHDDYTGAPADGSAWTAAACQEHELRGGSWFSSPRVVNVSYRNRFDPDYRSSSVGFRVARDIEQ